MGASDLYMLTDRGTLRGQQVINVYFYRQNITIGSSPSEALVDAYLAELLPLILDAQPADVLHTEIEAQNLFNPSDKHVRGISEPGQYGLDPSSNFDAIGFALSQDNGAVKNGAKRYPGVPDAAEEEGVITSAGYLAILALIAAGLPAPLAVGLTDVFFPVIVKRINEGPGLYRLPSNLGESTYGSITDAVFNPLVTTQNSRKIGRGA